jgi:hypothetical protein
MITEKLRVYSEKCKAVLLTGVDKPRMGYSPASKQFGVWFDDISVNWGNTDENAFDKFRPTTEYFYYSIDMPELWQKQCHLMRRVMEPIVTERPAFYNDIHFKSPRGNGNEIFSVHHMFFKQMLYKDWTVDIFQTEKPTSLFFQEHSNWFFKSGLTDKRSKDFHSGQVMEFVSGVDPAFIKRDSDGKPMRFNDMQTQVIAI